MPRSARVDAGEAPVDRAVPRRFDTGPDDRQAVALTYAMADYATGEGDAAPPAEVASFQTLGDPCHYRATVAEAQGAGHVEFCGLEDGLFVHFGDVTHAEPYAMAVSAPDMLRVRIASASDGEYVPARGDRLDIRGPGTAIIIEPPGLPPAEAAFAGRNRMALVCVHRDVLRRLYGDSDGELPGIVQAFVAGTVQQTVARRLPVDPMLLRCLDDLHGCTLTGHGRRLFIRSKAIEMLCHGFAAMAQDACGSPEASAMTARGVLKAQRLLIDNFVTPPSLDDLAQDVGLSRSGLCAGFRQILGQTVYDYIADLRMQRALALLNQREASITQIAYAVGYSHPSSFSVAVQRRFGTTPSKLRGRDLMIV